MTLWCERRLQGGRNSGRAVAKISIGACAPRSARACMRSSDVGSAQCRSSNASATGCERAPARNHVVSAASCRRRNSSGASFAARCSAAGCRPAAQAGAHIRRRRGRSAEACSRGRRGAGRQAHPRRSAGGPIRRSGAKAYSARAATTPIRQKCGASRQASRETPHEARLADAGFADNER